MGAANGKKVGKKTRRVATSVDIQIRKQEIKSSEKAATADVDMQRKYVNDLTRKVFEGARSGDAVSLSKVLQEMNISERTTALETKMDAFVLYGNRFDRSKITPLIVSVQSGSLDCVQVLLNFKADIEGRSDDILIFNTCPFRGCTPLFVAAAYENLDILSCLVKNGADVNATTNDNCTPLMIASKYNNVNAVTFLIEHGAKMDLKDKTGQTALHYAVYHNNDCFDVLSCLIKNGADANAHTNENCTPLMIASRKGDVNMVTCLLEHGTDIDHQGKDGDTALHYAVRYDQWETLSCLIKHGASELYNNQRLTPLFLASDLRNISLVEALVDKPTCTKKLRIEAIELLGTSLALKSLLPEDASQGFAYIKRGMKERFQDPSQPLLKQPVEPIKVYQNRKECQILEELSQIEGDVEAIHMESLIIRERILGTNSSALVGPIGSVADSYYKTVDKFTSMGLYRHAIMIAHSSNEPAFSDLFQLSFLLIEKARSNDPPSQKDFLELLEQTVVEYEIHQKLRIELGKCGVTTIGKRRRPGLHDLLESTKNFVHMIAKFKNCEEGKTLCVSSLMKRLCCLNPRGCHGNTLLHNAVEDHPYYFPYAVHIETVKLLLTAGISVNAVNNDGDTPLHRAVTCTFLKPSSDEIHLVTKMLEVLLDAGAHHDFVNNRGKTAMDMAKTDEARRILSEKRKLELKCISARAVKKFGLPYLEIVPKTLEKYISMH